MPLWRELPGRWIYLNDAQATADPDQAIAELTDRLQAEVSTSLGSLSPSPIRLVAWCDHCGALIASAEFPQQVATGYQMLEPTGTGAWRVATEFASWSDLAWRCGDHRHDTPDDGPVRFYLIDPVGPAKYERVGTWADVVAAIPHFLGRNGPIPPRSALNDLLRLGVRDSGMSGGAEWPPHELSVQDYQQVREKLLNQPDSPHAQVEVPDAPGATEANEFIEQHPEAAYVAARYSNLSPETVRSWSSHSSRDVRFGLACRNDLPQDIIDALCSDPDRSVRAAADTHRR